MKLSKEEKRICKIADERQYPYLTREELISVIELYQSRNGKIL